MYFPRLEIINIELRVGACELGDIPRYLESVMPLECVTVLYWYKKDWLVLNKGNANYEWYKNILQEYLQLNDWQRKEVKEFSETMGMTFFKFINEVLRIRRKRLNAAIRKTA
ncbi:hypothetical protein [Sellimonas intestinalis]|uniref:hypothetical protein n=1 Tax=Sellimonas intestinalis TaxID=1653434 RepID=UPI0015EB56E6|nr:hypothetical protein [Sellimonas intestinalis]MBA2215240.1 hypothetical protein [Sellimonas intestinalis]